jgi:hypothetical protein
MGHRRIEIATMKAVAPCVNNIESFMAIIDENDYRPAQTADVGSDQLRRFERTAPERRLTRSEAGRRDGCLAVSCNGPSTDQGPWLD